MKKLLGFLTVILLFTASSCNVYKQIPAYLDKHDFQEQHSVNPQTGANQFYASIDSLYDYSKVTEVCDTADVTFHISQGKVEVYANCTSGGTRLVEILKTLLSKIDFWK